MGTLGGSECRAVYAHPRLTAGLPHGRLAVRLCTQASSGVHGAHRRSEADGVWTWAVVAAAQSGRRKGRGLGSGEGQGLLSYGVWAGPSENSCVGQQVAPEVRGLVGHRLGRGAVFGSESGSLWCVCTARGVVGPAGGPRGPAHRAQRRPRADHPVGPCLAVP